MSRLLRAHVYAGLEGASHLTPCYYLNLIFDRLIFGSTMVGRFWIKNLPIIVQNLSSRVVPENKPIRNEPIKNEHRVTIEFNRPHRSHPLI